MRDYIVTYKSVPLMCDSLSAICLAHNPVFHERVKHIKVRHHFLRDHVKKGDIEMKFIDIEPVARVSWFGPQNWQLRFGDLDLKIIVTVS
jgi:hypothetical protein